MAINHQKNLLDLNLLENDFNSSNTLSQMYLVIDKTYDFIKDVSIKYYKNGGFEKQYYDLIKRALAMENKMPLSFIAESTPIINGITLKKSDIKDNNEEILKWLVDEVRLRLAMKNDGDIKDASLVNCCHRSCIYLDMVCAFLGNDNIKSQKYIIYPGYDAKSKIFDGRGLHFFSIVNVNNESYLVDCTYRQFFTLKGNSLHKIGVPLISPPKAGSFMLIDDNRKKLAEELLKNGYIKLTEDNLKNYLDGFSISYRNGLFYEDNPGYGYKTDYDYEAYMKFLEKKDCQLNHEESEWLGFQMKPLKRKRNK